MKVRHMGDVRDEELLDFASPLADMEHFFGVLPPDCLLTSAKIKLIRLALLTSLTLIRGQEKL